MADSGDVQPVPVPAWAHAVGMLDLGSPVRPAVTAGLVDRAIFVERIARYCWAYDERRLDRLAECFAQDAVWEGNVLGRVPIGPMEGRQKIVDWLSEFWPYQKDQRRHMILNTIVEEQSPEAAVSLSYLLLMSSTGEAVSMESMGFYRVAYRKVDGDWLIARLTAGFDKPFWPGALEALSERGRARHGIDPSS